MLRKAIAFARALFARKPAAPDWAPTYDPNESVELPSWQPLKLDPGTEVRSHDGLTVISNIGSTPLFVAAPPSPRSSLLCDLQRARASRERVLEALYDREPGHEAVTLADTLIRRAKGE